MSIEDLNIPVSVKCAASVIASIVIGTFVVTGHAKDIETSSRQAHASAEEARKVAGEIAAHVSKIGDHALSNDKRIAALEQAILQSAKDQEERKQSEKEIKKELSELQVKLSKMEGNSEAQTQAILRVLARLEAKVEK